MKTQKMIRLLEVRSPENPKKPLLFELTELEIGGQFLQCIDYMENEKVYAGFTAVAPMEGMNVKLRIEGTFIPIGTHDLGNLSDYFDGACLGEAWEFKKIEMPVKEYESLPEFDGW